ncbi:MAG: hypothetical protein JO272_13415 [Pseudonocardiales bacterium]|nr:hypothetical protein [Pseudonocardiales bacterium]
MRVVKERGGGIVRGVLLLDDAGGEGELLIVSCPTVSRMPDRVRGLPG